MSHWIVLQLCVHGQHKTGINGFLKEPKSGLETGREIYWEWKGREWGMGMIDIHCAHL